jgi:hypothetical protein
LTLAEDNNGRVRRRVMATLGELLFYVAIIRSDAVRGSDFHRLISVTPMPARFSTLLGRKLVRLTTLKTIDNIATQLGSWPDKL